MTLILIIALIAAIVHLVRRNRDLRTIIERQPERIDFDAYAREHRRFIQRDY